MNSQAQRRRRQDSRSSSSCRKLSCHAVVTLLLLASEAPGVVSKHNHGHEHEDHGEEEDFSAIVAGLPPGFTFGAATAAYQIEGGVHEGGRGDTIWDTFSHMDPPKVANNASGDVACDSYHRYDEDAELVKAAGFDAFRISFAWSRIYPEGEGDEPNAEGIQHYHDVLDAMIDRGLEPMVTLYHWDLPQALEDKYGGWLGPEIVQAFASYADTCFKEYGGKVKKWLTINEAWSFVHHGYSSGMHAPGRCTDRDICAEGDSFTEPYLAGHHVIIAHAHAVSIYRHKYKREQGGIIAMTLNMDWTNPLDPDSEADKEASQRFPEFEVGWFADPIYFGEYPQSMRDRIGSRLPTFTDEERVLVMGSNDFFGFNHYTSFYVTDIPDASPPRPGTTPAKALAAGIELPPTPAGDGWAQDMGLIQTKFDLDGKINGMRTYSDWLTGVPPGFRSALAWVSNRYGRPPILITENGMDRAGEWQMSIEDAVHDDDRITFYKGYLAEMVAAIVEDGVDARAYYAWSLLDNFEWSDGYHPRFGLTYVDYDNDQERTPKDSSKWFAKLSEARKKRYADLRAGIAAGASTTDENGNEAGADCATSLDSEHARVDNHVTVGGSDRSAKRDRAMFALSIGGVALVVLGMAGLVGYKIGSGSLWRYRGLTGRRAEYEGV